MISKRKAAVAAKTAVLLGLSLTLPACASIVRGTTDQVSFETSPPKASISTSNGFQCSQTPCTLNIPRRERFTTTVRHEGYEDGFAEVKPKISLNGITIYFGNVIFGGLVGAFIDNITGAYYDLAPNPVKVELKAIEVPAFDEAADATEARAVPLETTL